jgi:hypothetical protein
MNARMYWNELPAIVINTSTDIMKNSFAASELSVLTCSLGFWFGLGMCLVYRRPPSGL